jgi:hypothetical protein
MAVIRSEQYVELYSELAELMLEANNVDLPPEILLVTEANGDVRYTDAAQDRFNDYCDEVEAVLSKNNIIKVSDFEYNVLQVALDHMIEHQEGLKLYEIEIDPSDDVPCDDAQWDDICERLEAAKKLKALFS